MLIGDQTSYLETLSINTPRVFRAKTAAAIFKRKRLLAVGYNKDKTHPLQGRFCKHPEALFLHAEIDAIQLFLRSNPKKELVGSDMYVCRTLDDGSLRNAKPCSGCLRALENYGFRAIFYTEKGNKWSTIQLSALNL